MKPHYKKRLQKLLELMKTVPQKRFEISQWADAGFCSKANPSEAFHSECGTAACVGGWACTVPAFKKAGLRLEKVIARDYEGSLQPVFNGKEQFDALEAFFGLEGLPVPAKFKVVGYRAESLVDYIFHGFNPNTTASAVKRIENVLKFVRRYNG